jgi:peptide/nickel transport system ATP-binding protein
MNTAERGPQAGPRPGGVGPAPAGVPPLLEVRDLAVTYGSGDAAVRAVRGVGFTLHAGQTMGMAGESGCGKTTVALSLLRLLPRTASMSGQILFKGENNHRPGLAEAAGGALGRGVGGLPGRDERTEPGSHHR